MRKLSKKFMVLVLAIILVSSQTVMAFADESIPKSTKEYVLVSEDITAQAIAKQKAILEGDIQGTAGTGNVQRKDLGEAVGLEQKAGTVQVESPKSTEAAGEKYGDAMLPVPYKSEVAKEMQDSPLSSPVLTSSWQKSFGDTGDDGIYSIAKTSDGGYITCGYETFIGSSSTHAGEDICVTKLDANGNIIFSYLIGGLNDEWGHSIIQTSDGGYALTGTVSFPSDRDIVVIKLNSYGSIVWSQVVDMIGYDDFGNSIQQTGDGGYIIGGNYGYSYTDQDFLIMKTDSYGNLSWTTRSGDGNWQVGLDAKQTSDGGYIITGNENSHSGLVKFNSYGAFQWEWVDTSYESSIGFSVLQKSNGNYVVAGAYDEDMLVFELSSSGSGLAFASTFGGAGYDCAYSVKQTTDGGYVLAGNYLNTSTGDNDAYIVKTNSLGEREVEKRMGNTACDYAYSVVQANDGGYVGAGYTVNTQGSWNNDSYVFKLSVDAPPVISGSDPSNGATGVAINKNITVNFSENIAADTAFNSITLKDSANSSVPVSLSITGNTLYINHIAPFNYNTQYTVTIPAGAIKDSSGNSMSNTGTIVFTTQQEPVTPLAVSSTDPVNNSNNIPVNKAITITFNKAISASTAYGSITLKDSSNAAVSFTKSINSNVLTVTPSANLANNKTYTLIIPANAVKDASNNNYASVITVIFTTQTGSTPTLGDVNNDGNIDVRDVMKVLKYDAGLEQLTDTQKTAADVNRDSSVDVRDALQILRYDAGLITTF